MLNSLLSLLGRAIDLCPEVYFTKVGYSPVCTLVSYLGLAIRIKSWSVLHKSGILTSLLSYLGLALSSCPEVYFTVYSHICLALGKHEMLTGLLSYLELALGLCLEVYLNMGYSPVYSLFEALLWT